MATSTPTTPVNYQPLSAQELFNKAVGGIIAQGDFAYEEDIGCLYRTSTGKSCAAGQIIPDEIYSPDFENLSIGCVCAVSSEIATIIGENLALVSALQGAHDTAAKLGQTDFQMIFFIKECQTVANKYQLSADILPK